MEDHRPAKIKFDFERYGRRVREGPCFVCAMLAGIDAATQATLAQTIRRQLPASRARTRP